MLQSTDGNAVRGRLWTKQAAAADAGSTVTRDDQRVAKSVMSVAAYHSSDGVSSVTASAGATGTTADLPHRPRASTSPTTNSWLVNVYTEKSSVTASLDRCRPSSTQRTTAAGTGSGKVSGILADSNGSGRDRRRRRADRDHQRRRLARRALLPRRQPGPDPGAGQPRAHARRSPRAARTLTCSFDASSSADPDGDPITYAWNFGDGQTGTGETPSHTYATAGNKTVTLTVSDGTLTGTTSSQVTATQPGRRPRPHHAGPRHRSDGPADHQQR